MKKRTMKTTALMLIALLALPLVSFGQEKKESQPTMDNLVQYVKKYILNEQRQNDGYFQVYDPVTEKTLKLRLTKVHTERFSQLGENKYFDCVNFEGTDGNKYDIDIFLKWEGDSFETTKRMVHKVNGEERYTWYEDDGVWKTKPIVKHSLSIKREADKKTEKKTEKKKSKGSEHPAH